MPARKDIETILIIGSGPIVIGQASEFDYSGTQACTALNAMGYRTVLVNSNPATIMTDPEIADQTYIEPLNLQRLTQIIEKERPDALLPNLGGQSALNLCLQLHEAGVLERYGVLVIGIQVDAIARGEDRIIFKETMAQLGIEMPLSFSANTVTEAEEHARKLGFPLVIRPAYTMGGTGGGLVYNQEELKVVAERGIAASLIGQILLEESVLGWEEIELEIVRDAKNQMITVCLIENIDAVGIHTGDSFCCVPCLTVSEAVQKRLEAYAYQVAEAIGVVGGANVQFAHDPVTGRIVIIEMNPRTSRSSALASKASGFPIARVSAMLAVGITLDELPYWRGKSLVDYVPADDVVVVKFARWAFEKFVGVQDHLGTQMRAVGEVMSIGKNFKEALQKAIRSLEINRYGLGFAKNFNSLTLAELLSLLLEPSSERQFIIYEALRKGADIEDLARLTQIKPFFLRQLQELVDLEEEILSARTADLPAELLTQAKLAGFADRYLAQLLSVKEKEIRAKRLAIGLTESWLPIRVCAVENASYYFSTYQPGDAITTEKKAKIMVLGGGPNRIGQGIEFDYCCVHAVLALKNLGYQTIMVNCNPETVSTDYDTADKLYFDPLTVEEVLSIYEKEQPLGILVQFGGQTPLNIASELEEAGVRILGTSPAQIDLAEDRDRFRQMMQDEGIPMPESEMAVNIDQALAAAGKLDYPLMVRPSYVLGGRGMEIILNETMLRHYMAAAIDVTPDRPILIDRFLRQATEIEVDAVCDGTDVFLPAVMEHIELAGIHSGDSACVVPAISIADRHLQTIDRYTQAIARALKVVGLINIQFALADDTVYVLEANPRASRTVPIIAKVCNLAIAQIAAETICAVFEQKPAALASLRQPHLKHFGVKEAVFPFNMFPEVDPVLGPEMRSTGEVLGLADTFELAYFKAQEAALSPLPTGGNVLISVNDEDKAAAVEIARLFAELNFTILATQGTAHLLRNNEIPVTAVNKIYEGRPHILDHLANREIQLVINSAAGPQSQHDDSYIRKAAIRYKIAYITTMTAAKASVRGIKAFIEGDGQPGPVKSLQQYSAQSPDQDN